MLQEIDHPEYGPLTVPHSPLQVGSFRAELRPSPALGQDNEAVYGDWLGLTPDEIRGLADRGVI
jgi:crotonobetainyl-CoA:carnitine CoA-transferase CaiB-like acyl-CoA transferase